MFIDSHCHLDMLNLDSHDGSLDNALSAARSAGVNGFLCIGIGLDKAESLMLDYHYSPDSREAQIVSFRTHLQVAETLQKPVIIHTRDAKEDTIDLMRAHSRAVGVLHCFTESWEMAKQALDLGYYISISGIVTFRNASALREVVKRLPLDRLLIETDSPYLAPIPYRGQPNQPAFLPEVASCVAELVGVDIEKLGELTSQNFHRLFSTDGTT